MKISIITFPTVAVNSKSWTGISSGVLISVPSLAASSTSDSSTTSKTIHTQLIWISPISDWHSLQSLVKTFHPTVVKITMQLGTIFLQLTPTKILLRNLIPVLTLWPSWVTKTEFLLTISIQYQVSKWWEKRKYQPRDH